MLSTQRFSFCALTVCLFLAACEQKQPAAAPPVYDEAQLRAFVLSTPTLTEKVVADSLQHILVKASPDSVVFRRTLLFLTEPFSSPNSSYRSQPMYATLLTATMQSKWYNSEEKANAQVKLTLSQQNLVGHAANDFSYTSPDGQVKRMYGVKANFLLLYFNNPECEACKEMKAALTQSAVINQKIQTGELKVLSIYADADKKIWKAHLGECPTKWLQGIGESGTSYKKIYDLSAIPTMYLLDKDKQVLLKDYFPVQDIERLVK